MDVLVPVVAICQHQEALALFGKRPAPQSDEERRAAEVDLERIRDGGIPLGAEQRLKGVAASSSPVFSSDLSAKEYAVAQASGLTPIAQIMGSSVVQHGWQNYGWSGYGDGVREMPSFAAPWNLSRQRSFDRLRQEAQFAGADAVIGVEMTAKGFLGEPGNVEYAVFGTAVRDSAVGRSGRSGPRMCALSGQDVYKLRRIGAETLAVIGHTSVVCVALSPMANQMMRSWWGNQELVEVSEAVYAARGLAMDEVRRQASQAGANEMVISTLRHVIDHHEYDRGGFTQHFFIVSMHVLGTAIALGAHESQPADLGVPMMSINLGV
ncbi:MAG TPA: heavy metal-binding domain-containing protein [Solirubrobacteraceae bacterium]